MTPVGEATVESAARDWPRARRIGRARDRRDMLKPMLAKSDIQREALNLPTRERIELVMKLWDSLAPGEVPVPAWQRDLIRERLAALDHVLPEERSVPWEAVRKRVFTDKT